MSELQAPAGYCPFCEYPIDPGVCPECGRAVLAARLARSPLRAKLRRLFSPTRIAVCLGLLSVAVLFFSFADWIRFVPTDALILFHGKQNSKTMLELHRRVAEGRVSTEQCGKIISAGVRLVLTARSPAPASMVVVTGKLAKDLPFGVGVKAGPCRIIGSGWSGELRMTPRQSPLDEGKYWYRLPPMAADRYHIEVIQSLTPGILFPTTISTSVTLPTVIDVRSSIELVAVDRPTSKFVRCESTPSVFQSVQNRLIARLLFFPRLNLYSLEFRGYQLPAAIFGNVWIRSGHEGPYKMLNDLLILRVGHNAKANMGFGVDSSLPRPSETSTFDIRMLPDIEAPFNAGYDRFFDGVLVWSDLRLGSIETVPQNRGPDLVLEVPPETKSQGWQFPTRILPSLGDDSAAIFGPLQSDSMSPTTAAMHSAGAP